MTPEWLDVLERVETARKQLNCSRSGAFYRGHSRGTHQLVPSLLRNRLGEDTERDLYAECVVRARRLFQGTTSSWEMLSVFQHYGIPTRLLDWTESLAVAVFFAIAVNPEGAHVWVLNP